MALGAPRLGVVELGFGVRGALVSVRHVLCGVVVCRRFL